jgi:hypothetical protein
MRDLRHHGQPHTIGRPGPEAIQQLRYRRGVLDLFRVQRLTDRRESIGLLNR